MVFAKWWSVVCTLDGSWRGAVCWSGCCLLICKRSSPNGGVSFADWGIACGGAVSCSANGLRQTCLQISGLVSAVTLRDEFVAFLLSYLTLVIGSIVAFSKSTLKRAANLETQRTTTTNTMKPPIMTDLDCLPCILFQPGNKHKRNLETIYFRSLLRYHQQTLSSDSSSIDHSSLQRLNNVDTTVTHWHSIWSVRQWQRLRVLYLGLAQYAPCSRNAFKATSFSTRS